MSCAAVALTAEAHAETVPSAVTKIKLGAFPCTRKPPVPLYTIPVGVDGAVPFADGGTVGLVALGAPLLLYTVERPVPPSVTQKGLLDEVANPQGFTMFGSAKSARPGWSATRLWTR